MLSNSRVDATLPTNDLERAKSFYREKLGLTPAQEDPGGAFYNQGDSSGFLLFLSSGKASGDHTQMGFAVDDVEATVADLRSKGVDFLEDDTPDLKTENGIATFGSTRVAWFKDSEGNVIALNQEG